MFNLHQNMNMKKLVTYILLSFTAFLNFTSCSSGSGDGEDDKVKGTAPTLISSTPTNGATDLAADDMTITLTFNQNISFVTANYTKITLGTATVTSAQVTSAYNALSITAKGFTKGTTYKLIIPAGLIKGSGTLYNSEISISFSTKTSTLATSLCDANATAKAKSLYAYLLSIYGTKCLSATMASVSWNHTEADQVYKLTGKYPAINCFDFLHIYYSPANWIDYTNITPVTEWANAGGIVSLMWHVNVPLKEGSTDLTTDPNKTTFRCSNIFTSGTWENKFFYEQMDKVCATLVKIQDAGIAALWRPFHEAAGNYYAKQYKGSAWFWWGYDGPEAYVKLWKLMYNYFQTKGIHNLIWIWTTQANNGDSSKYDSDSAYYPGNEYVDIVGRDLYGDDTTASYNEWVTVNTTYGQKMNALAECGNGVTDSGSALTLKNTQATISSQWSKGCRWLYFMPWYDYYYDNGKSTTNNMCSSSFWTDAMSQSYVLSRSDVKY